MAEKTAAGSGQAEAAKGRRAWEQAAEQAAPAKGRRARKQAKAAAARGQAAPAKGRRAWEQAAEQAAPAKGRRARKQAKAAAGGGWADARRVARLLRRFTAGQRRVFMFAFILLAFEASTAVFESYPIAYLIDFLTGERRVLPFASSRYGTIAVLTGAIVAVAAVNSLADSLAEICLARGGRTLGFNLRVTLYNHLQKLSLAFHNRRRTGDVLTRVTSDVTALEEFVVKSVSDIAGSILVLIGTLAFLLYKSWQVTLVAIGIVPLLSLVSNYFAKRIKAAAKRQRAREGDLANTAQEMLTSIGVIQIYGRSGEEEKRFAAQSEKAMEAALAGAGLEAKFSWVVSVLEALCISAIVWLGFYLVDRKALTVGLLVMFILLIQNMFKPTRRIIKEWNTVGKIYASVERIGELLDREPTVRDEPGAVEAPRVVGHLEFRDVSFAYQADPEPGDKAGKEAGNGSAPPLRLALDRMSFTVAPGQTVALVGPSGAGKSTVAQLVPRLYDPHAGHVLLDGHDMREYTLESLRAQISMVLQETVLFSGTVAGNIGYGRADATREEIVAAAKRANAHEFIQQMPEGYDTELNERAANLSGGQRQRIAIARAFIRDTPVLVLDEPTTGLDAESTHLVLDALKTLLRGKTTVVISHDLNLIRSADRILVISDGRIAQQGTHRALLEQGGLYADLYARQFGEARAGAEAEAEPVAARTPAAPSPLAALGPDGDGDEPRPVSRKVFETALMQALPLPASPEAFRLLAGRPVPLPTRREPAPTGQEPPPPDRPAEWAEPRPPSGPAEWAEPRPPSGPVPQREPSPLGERPPHGDPPLGVLPAVGPPPGAHAPVGSPPVGRALGGPPPGGQATPEERPQWGEALPAPGDDATRLSSPSWSRPMLDLLRSPAFRRELPRLGEVLDPEAMTPLVQQLLAGGWVVERCAPGKAFYLPGEGCSLRYRLELRDTASGRSDEHLVGGRVFPDGEGERFLRDRLEPLARRAAGREELAPFARPVAIVEPLRLVLHAYPVDGDLPMLLEATDPSRMVAVLGETLPDAVAGHLAIEACRVELAQYARRDRCVLRYELTGRHTGTGQATRRVVYGKVHRDGHGGLVGPVVAALRDHILDGRGHRFAVPRFQGSNADLHLSLLEAIPGSPQVAALIRARVGGRAQLADGLTLEHALDTCGRVAATLHTSGIELGEARTLDSELAAVRDGLDAVRRLGLPLCQLLDEHLERAETAAAEAEALPACFAHGDYTPAQVMFAGPVTGLIDFDTVGQAEPALDLGQFVAYLRVLVSKAQRASGQAPDQLGTDLGESFLRVYAEAAGISDAEFRALRRRAGACQTVSLVRMALRSWQQLKVDRLENVLAVIEASR